jgi:hypothetical protein
MKARVANTINRNDVVWRRLIGTDAISVSPHRVNERRIGVPIDLPAQAAHVNVENS